MEYHLFLFANFSSESFKHNFQENLLMAKCSFCLSIQFKYDINVSKDLYIEIYL
jgi:hypothetical protein